MLFLAFPRHSWSEQPQIPLAESSCPLCQGCGRMPCCHHCWRHHAAGEGIRTLCWEKEVGGAVGQLGWKESSQVELVVELARGAVGGAGDAPIALQGQAFPRDLCPKHGQRALLLCCWPGLGCPCQQRWCCPCGAFLGHWHLTSLSFVDLRWLTSKSSCCAVLAWTLPVLWSSPVVSVLGWQGGLSSCKGCSLPFNTLLSALKATWHPFYKSGQQRGCVSSLSL